MGSLVSYTTLEAYSGVKLLKPEPQSQVPDPPGFLIFVIRAVRFLEALKAIEEATAQLQSRHAEPLPANEIKCEVSPQPPQC